MSQVMIVCFLFIYHKVLTKLAFIYVFLICLIREHCSYKCMVLWLCIIEEKYQNGPSEF